MQIRRTKLVQEAMTHEFPINMIMVSFGTCKLDVAIIELMKARPDDWKEILVKQTDAVLIHGRHSEHTREIFYDFYRDRLTIDDVAKKHGITPQRVGHVICLCHRTLDADTIRNQISICVRQPMEDCKLSDTRLAQSWPWNVVYDAFGDNSQTYIDAMINRHGPKMAVVQFEKGLHYVLTKTIAIPKWERDLDIFYLYYREGRSKEYVCTTLGITETVFDVAIKRIITLLPNGTRPLHLFRGISLTAIPDLSTSKECLYLSEVFPDNNALRHALQRAGYSTLSAIYDLGFLDTIKIPRIGPRSIETILTAFRAYGFDTVDYCNR